MTMDPLALRKTLGHFATGVVVVTSRCPQGQPVGLTINAFSAVSLDPPLILFSLAKTSFNHENFLQAKSYALNILALEQQDISNRFARAGTDKWSGIAMQEGLHGAPIIQNCLACLVCTPYSRCDGGDHTIFLAKIEYHHSRPGQPLLFFGGHYHSLQDENKDPAFSQAAWFDTLI